MDKNVREEREYKSLFADERYAKKAWRKFIGQSLESPASPLEFIGSSGEPTRDSIIYNTAYNSVKQRLLAEGISREPMKAEVLVETNVIRASFETTTFNTILERTAGKVKDEVSISTSAYEDLTDEQLELLARHEAKKRLEDDNA